jgi:hypothetical protein
MIKVNCPQLFFYTFIDITNDQARYNTDSFTLALGVKYL